MVNFNLIRRVIPPIVALAMFMEALDSTILNTAIPVMSDSLKVNPINLKVALISYLLSLAIFIPISGWCADKWGIKKVFTAALTIFTLSSLACGFSSSVLMLVAARSVQGIGGAFMLPVGRLLVLRIFGRKEFVQVMNRIVIPALIGPALGPLLGGWISETWGWRWIFWVNIPLGLIAIACAQLFLHEQRSQELPSFDGRGFLLFGLGVAGTAFGLSALSEDVFPYSLIAILMAISISILCAYGWHAKYTPFPVVRIKLLTQRVLRISILGNILTRLGFGGLPFLLPLLLQLVLNYSPKEAGAVVAFAAVGAMLLKTFSYRLLRRFGFKKLLLANTLMLGFTLWAFALVHQGTPFYWVILLTLAYGVCSSLQFSTMNPLAYAETLPEDLSSVTSMLAVTQQLAMSFGVAISALLLRSFAALRQGQLLGLQDFQHSFMALGAITIFASCIFYFLKHDDGKNLYH